MKTPVQAPEPPRRKGQGQISRAGKKGASLTREELAQIKQEMTDYFFAPPCEEESQVTVIAVDPYCIHVYLSIREKDLTRRRQQLKTNQPIPPVLRFYDFTDRASPGPSYFDIPVAAKKNHRYVDLWAEGKRYLVELGLQDQRGCFSALARSNIVDTPRARAHPIAAVAPASFLRRDITPPVPVKPVPQEFSLSPEERATHTRQRLAHHFSSFAETAPTSAKAGDQAKPSALSAWSTSRPRGKS